MKKSTCVLFGVLIAAVAVLQTTHAGPVELSASDFDEKVADGNLYFIKFFAPWCGHCKRLAPTWDQLAEEKTADDVVVAKVDCTKEKDVCSKAGVKGYPTLKVFHAGEEKVKYSGARTLEALGDFLEEQRKLYMAETEA